MSCRPVQLDAFASQRDLLFHPQTDFLLETDVLATFDDVLIHVTDAIGLLRRQDIMICASYQFVARFAEEDTCRMVQEAEARIRALNYDGWEMASRMTESSSSNDIGRPDNLTSEFRMTLDLFGLDGCENSSAV
ncbi:hypothetical protein C7476_13123 [Phyllobacterium bourgognense]|uniref:Uncharacterized protein n=1 Tax=Phyllobacterium bourgognense TaxID=314236 RepID=A0A368YD29_9HYPH|nr:hypothetical protein C7476_13123 [Phyllobacterium bourgognense]